MANYGYVILKNNITFKDLKELTKSFNKTLNRPLTIYINDDNSICLKTTIDNDCLLLWLDTYKQSPCIIFEHRHVYEIFWWLSSNMMNYFAWHLYGKIADDGFDGMISPTLNKYPTLNSWIKIYKKRMLRITKRFIIKSELKMLPEFKSYLK